MIDTIKIRLPLRIPSEVISENFHPVSLNTLTKTSKTYLSTRFNPGKTLARGSAYTPTYIGEKFIVDGAPLYYLAVEVSLPKLLFGNNVEEMTLDIDEFDYAVGAIKKSLMNDLGLSYTTSEIKEAEVVKIHVGKNFTFNDPGAPLFVIDTIQKSRADRLCDDNQTKYENLGFSFRLHTNNKEVIFYDKKKDIEQAKKSPKRSIDGDSMCEAYLTNSYTPLLIQDETIGILRMEVRLNNKTQIKKAFPSIRNNLSFANITENAPILGYLESEWLKATRAISIVELSKPSTHVIFGEIIANQKYNLSLRDSLAIAAANAIINEQGLNYFRSQIESHYSRDAWYRLRKRIYLPECGRASYLKQIEEEFQYYRPIAGEDRTCNA